MTAPDTRRASARSSEPNETPPADRSAGGSNAAPDSFPRPDLHRADAANLPDWLDHAAVVLEPPDPLALPVERAVQADPLAQRHTAVGLRTPFHAADVSLAPLQAPRFARRELPAAHPAVCADAAPARETASAVAMTRIASRFMMSSS